MATFGDLLRCRRAAYRHSRAAIVAVSGEIDAGNADDVRTYVDGVIADAPALILDFSGVEFFGVAGLQTLVAIGDKCEKASLPWALLTSDAVNLVLRISDRDRRFPAVDSMVEALKLTPPALRARSSLPVTPRGLTRC